MQYSPKLKTAAEEIKDILKKHDIAGIVVLHTPGFGEYVYRIDPSYSIAKLQGDMLRLKTNPADSNETKLQQANDTYNMFTVLADCGGPLFLNAMDAVKLLENHIEVIYKSPGGHTSHEQQNN